MVCRRMIDPSAVNMHEVVDSVYRTESRRILAALIRLLRDYANCRTTTTWNHKTE